MGLREEKERIRESVWGRMLRENAALPPFPVYGRIPNFKGAREAAQALRGWEAYRRSEVIFCNPDSPQRHVREFALRDGKVVVMASPRLRSGFLLLDPRKIPPPRFSAACTIAGAFKYGVKILENVPMIDLKVAGSVAVDSLGGRVGKGRGFSDLEYAILKTLGVIGEDTPIVTTVHELQIVESIPMDSHDVPVDCIFTPKRIIMTKRAYPRPPGIIWEKVRKEDMDQVPLLRLLYGTRAPSSPTG
jgi:5-formyltetrahydrofolate cyclo-ligase